MDEREKEKSRNMYEAWKRSEEKSKEKTKAAGVAVVQTLVKEVKRKKKSAEEELQILKEQAKQQLHQAAIHHHHPAAMVQLGNSLLENPDAEAIEKAMDLYRNAGEMGSAEGWFNLGHCYWEGVSNSDKEILASDKEVAMEAFQKAIALGDADSMYFVGVNILGEYDVSDVQKLKEGFEYIKKAANMGHGGALYYLALLHLNGNEALRIPPCSKQEFVMHLNTAVEHDSSGDAHFLRGSCFYNGEDGYQKDMKKALLDFLKGAELGHADAAISAGALLHKGVQGVIAVDQQKAFELYQHAGELGSIEGWRNVVSCYATGEGVPKSLETAKYIANTMLRNDVTR